MLKDYPEHIQELQRSLNLVVEKPSIGTPPFEVAIWALEDELGSFISEARSELQAAEASGDAVAIERAKDKELLMLHARSKGGWIADEGLWDYFQVNKGAFK
jgi:hypothetical protein